jgi:HK97 family phage portal protein
MFRLFRKSAVYSLGAMAGWIGWGSTSGVAVNTTSSLDVTAVFCAARVIAEGIAQMPVRLVEDRFDSATGLVTLTHHRDHWAHRLLARKPNGWQTSYEFIEGMVFAAAIGKGAVAIKNVVGREVRELLPVPPGSWQIEQMPDWTLRLRIDYSDKTHGYFDLSQVFYLRGPSLNGYEALPAVRQAREAIGLSVALERQQAKLAGNGGKPSGVLAFKNRLSPETREKLRETWQGKFGAGGDGGVAVLDGDVSFHPMTMTSVDAQHLETRRLQIEEIARAFRVQPIMLMQSDKASTFASAEQMFRMHVIHTLGPWIERFEQAANRDILGGLTQLVDGVPLDLRFDLDERNLLRGDFKDQAEYYSKALGSGGSPAWMTQNEIRSEVGLNPINEPWANTVSQGARKPTEGDGDGI